MIYHDAGDQMLHLGDAYAVLTGLPDESVNCVVTSPPYFGLRDYGMTGQMGVEATPADYVASLAKVFTEIQRVLTVDGVAWLNLGDTYSTRTVVRDSSHQGGFHPDRTDHVSIGKSWVENRQSGIIRMPYQGIPEKNLLGMPWRVAFALQDDGWVLRNDIVWHKPNAMPHSVTDRLTSRYEHVFLFAKSKRYTFDLDAIREPVKYPDRVGHTFGGNKQGGRTTATERHVGAAYNPTGKGKNPGDVWTISTVPYRSAHFATFPPQLVERCILAGCPTGGTVLDPFVGSGTTLTVARQLGRRGIGIDLSAEYLDLAVTRIASAVVS